MAYHLGGCQAYRGYQLGGCQAMCNHTSHPRHFKVAKPCAIQPHIHVTKHPRHRTCTTSRATHLVHSSSSLIGARRRRACARDFRRTRHSDYLQRHAPSHHTKTAKNTIGGTWLGHTCSALQTIPHASRYTHIPDASRYTQMHLDIPTCTRGTTLRSFTHKASRYTHMHTRHYTRCACASRALPLHLWHTRRHLH